MSGNPSLSDSIGALLVLVGLALMMGGIYLALAWTLFLLFGPFVAIIGTGGVILASGLLLILAAS